MTFDEYQNRPVYKAKCATFTLCKKFLGLPAGDVATSPGHSVLLFRALPAYRDSRAIALRNTIAALMREQRRAVNPKEPT
jgi:hypothetical protein